MNRIFRAAFVAVALAAWPLWIAYDEEKRARAEAERRAAKAEREASATWDQQVMRRLGPRGARLLALWAGLYKGGQEDVLLAHAEALAIGEEWAPVRHSVEPAAMPWGPRLHAAVERVLAHKGQAPLGSGQRADLAELEEALVDVHVAAPEPQTRREGSSPPASMAGPVDQLTRLAEPIECLRDALHAAYQSVESMSDATVIDTATRELYRQLRVQEDTARKLADAAQVERTLLAKLEDADRALDQGRPARRCDEGAVTGSAPMLGDTTEELEAARKWLEPWIEPIGTILRSLAEQLETGVEARYLLGHVRKHEALLIARAAELDAAQGRGSWARPAPAANCPAHGPDPEPDGFTSLCTKLATCPPACEHGYAVPGLCPSCVDVAAEPNEPTSSSGQWVGATTGPECGDLGSHEPSADGERCERCGDGKAVPEPLRCAFDGCDQSADPAPEGGWAWLAVGGQWVCSERCRQRWHARVAEWSRDSAAATLPLGGEP